MGTLVLNRKSNGLQGASKSGFQKVQSVTKVGRNSNSIPRTPRDAGNALRVKPGKSSENGATKR